MEHFITVPMPFWGNVHFSSYILLKTEHVKVISDFDIGHASPAFKSWNGPGGGGEGVRDIINAVVDLLAFPFVAVQNGQGLPSATASVNSGFLLNVGSHGGRVCPEEKNMVKAIESHLGKYIQILLEAKCGIISLLIDRCADSDKSTQKFACLVTGNAAYHSQLLYVELRRSIPQLSHLLLSAEDDTTKANAAGALGNLVQYSNKLCEDIVLGHALCLNRLYFILIENAEFAHRTPLTKVDRSY